MTELSQVGFNIIMEIGNLLLYVGIGLLLGTIVGKFLNNRFSTMRAVIRLIEIMKYCIEILEFTKEDYANDHDYLYSRHVPRLKEEVAFLDKYSMYLVKNDILYFDLLENNLSAIKKYFDKRRDSKKTIINILRAVQKLRMSKILMEQETMSDEDRNNYTKEIATIEKYIMNIDDLFVRIN